jgi:hypothetical protein
MEKSSSIYRFNKLGTLWRDDHPLALYAGTRRLSPRPRLVWWWPVNWVAVVLVLPPVILDMLRGKHRNG